MVSADLCVIFNPVSGRQAGARRLEALRRRWGARAAFWPTDAPGHAEELARKAAATGFAVVAAAGGDGTVHEVANGLLTAGRPEVAFAVVPLGSANDYAHSLELAGPINRVDVARVREPGGRERYFVCCLGLGLNGAVTLESRRIRRLRGVALYGLATLRALYYHFDCPVMELTIDDELPWSAPTLMLSVLLGRREGGFVMAPDAKLDDGWLDFVHAGKLSRWEVLRFLPRLALAGPPADYDRVRQGRCKRIRLRSERALLVHLDGEFFCRPEENIRELEIEILPGRLLVRTDLPA
jgi:diacylglycerol kinase family enzyme